MQTATANDIAVIQALGADYGSREVSFKYLLMDQANVVIGDVTNHVVSCSIDMNMTADINRTAKFTFLDNGVIDFTNDRIQPWCYLTGTDTNGWPLGIFLLSSGQKYTTAAGVALRDVDGYDQNLVLKQDVDGGPLGTPGTRYTIPAGTRYTTAIQNLLNAYSGHGLATNNVSTASTATAVTAIDWNPGTPTLTIVNDLLKAINYYTLYFDELGVAQAQPYITPANRSSQFSYASDRTSIMYEDANRTADLFNVPNQWTRVVSLPDRSVLVATYTNNDPTNSTSTVSRGRTIADFATGSTAPDLPSLQAQVLQIATNASQIYETFEFYTAINPLHSFADVYTITFNNLAVSGTKYEETAWSVDLVAGGRMKHSARRVVALA